MKDALDTWRMKYSSVLTGLRVEKELVRKDEQGHEHDQDVV